MQEPATAEGVMAMIRNYLHEDDGLREVGSVVVPAAGDPLTLYVLQRGGDHLLIQVTRAEMVVR